MPDRPEFTEADLRQLAGPKSFERGQDYLHEVTDLDVTRTGATAIVRGGYDYAVFLDTGAGALTAGCSCPYGQEGNFCKHCVAVGLLAADAARTRGQNWPPWAAGPVLIDVLLDEGKLDAAWAAADGVGSQEQWLRLADAVATSRPADALPVYLRTVEPLRAQTGNGVYEQVARLLLAACGCHRVLGTTGEFDQYLALFRTDQKRKRNLMKILDQNGLRVGGE